MHRGRAVWIILLLAFMLRLGAAAYWHRQAVATDRLFRLGDSDSYWVLAGQIARGKPYQYGSENARVFRAPLLPLVLAPLTLIDDKPNAVWYARVFACMLGSVAVLQLMWLARRLSGDWAAVFTGLLAACSPSAIGMSIIILSEMLLIPLMLMHLMLWQSAWRAANESSANGSSVGWFAFGAGIVAGAAVLARPSWLLFAPFLFAVAFLTGPNRRAHAQIFAFTMLGLCLIMTPWWIRNAQVTGKFVLSTLQVGPSLYDGLHPGATGASDEGMAFSQTLVVEQIAEDQTAPQPLDSTLEYRVNRRAQRMAIAWARDNPKEVLRLALAKFCKTWSLWPDGGDMGSPAVRFAITVGTFAVLLLALYGTWGLASKSGWLIGVCWVPCLYFTLLHMVFVGSIRYREPAVFVLMPLAGCAIANIARRRFPVRNCATGLHGSDSAAGEESDN
jgi:4-amino-4-deoxy-L-arabinose transferase-like glycosyltransferase